MSAADRDGFISAHEQRQRLQLLATRHCYRPLWPNVIDGVALVLRHLLRLVAWAIGLVAGFAFLVAYLTRGAPTP